MTDKITPWQWVACALIVALQLADMVTTLAGLSLGAEEVNPIAQAIIGYGVHWFILMKLVAATAMGMLALVTRYLVWPFIALFVFAVANNISIITHLS